MYMQLIGTYWDDTVRNWMYKTTPQKVRLRDVVQAKIDERLRADEGMREQELMLTEQQIQEKTWCSSNNKKFPHSNPSAMSSYEELFVAFQRDLDVVLGAVQLAVHNVHACECGQLFELGPFIIVTSTAAEGPFKFAKRGAMTHGTKGGQGSKRGIKRSSSFKPQPVLVAQATHIEIDVVPDDSLHPVVEAVVLEPFSTTSISKPFALTSSTVYP